MKRKLMVAMVLLASFILSLTAAGASENRVYDSAELFSASEEREIMEEIAQFQEDTGMDFVVLTSKDAHDGAGQLKIGDEFYDRGGFGLDEERSGVLFYIDMYERLPSLTTTGKMIDYMTGDRTDDALAACHGDLGRGDYTAAVSRMISQVCGYVQKGIPEGQFRYDVITGQRLTARHKVLTTSEMLVCLLIAAVVAIVFTAIVKRSYKLKGSTYSYDYRENSQTEITGREDTYLRTTTTRTRKADPPSGGRGGGGGGGFGGGSGVHTSSSGTSHGGGVGSRF